MTSNGLAIPHRIFFANTERLRKEIEPLRMELLAIKSNPKEGDIVQFIDDYIEIIGRVRVNPIFESLFVGACPLPETGVRIIQEVELTGRPEVGDIIQIMHNGREIIGRVRDFGMHRIVGGFNPVPYTARIIEKAKN